MKNLPNKLFITLDNTSPIDLFVAETRAEDIADPEQLVIAGEYALIRYVDILPPVSAVKPHKAKKRK